ncbi:MAG: hypothetical protein ABI284_00580 [Nitrosospira sp.]
MPAVEVRPQDRRLDLPALDQGHTVEDLPACSGRKVGDLFVVYRDQWREEGPAPVDQGTAHAHESDRFYTARFEGTLSW